MKRCSSNHHKVMAQPQQHAQQRAGIRTDGETGGPLVLGLSGDFVHLYVSRPDLQLSTSSGVITPTRDVERDAARQVGQRPTSGRSASAAAVTTPGV